MNLNLFNIAAIGIALAFSTFASGQPQCNTGGSLLCCASSSSATRSPNALLLLLLEVEGVPADSTTGLVGLTCSPIDTAAGASASGISSCTQDVLCCANNTFNGVIATGCTPINT